MPNVRAHSAFEPLTVSRRTPVFVLTGAGISAESGVPTFRDAGGLWRSYRFEDVASPEAWAKDPSLVWKFYSERRAQLTGIKPNAAHLALAELERGLDDAWFLCTQNVDGLHELAGSRRLIHMHGELLKSRCERGHAPPFDDEALYSTLADIPRCDCGGRIRPHICWFGEVPFDLERVEAELARCRVFITIGSSGAVYPAAGFAAKARRAGARTVYVGPEAPENAELFDECRLGAATEAVPGLIRVSHSV
ncbi:MAG TPA: Sir2 family NAD-dependent protein deacetylase [Polyangiaceae bacterium]|nr:Sir2 family NAD-dependent protein deacetylase [Polyangiaceae bacterium]